MTLGSTLRELRERKGWRQGKLAAYASISQSHLSKIEADESKDVSARIVAELASALGVSIDYLCERAGWPTRLSDVGTLTSAESELILVIRSIKTASLRQAVLEQFTFIGHIARDADVVRQP